jgi:hypothetical protein
MNRQSSNQPEDQIETGGLSHRPHTPQENHRHVVIPGFRLGDERSGTETSPEGPEVPDLC